MKTKDDYIQEIGTLILLCETVIENEWDTLTFVFDTADGHTANSGFLYNGDKIRPASAGIDSSPLLLRDTIREFRELTAKDCGQKFKQLLIQMEKSSSKIKIDFEFDDGTRWKMVPAKIKEYRESLRPSF